MQSARTRRPLLYPGRIASAVSAAPRPPTASRAPPTHLARPPPPSLAGNNHLCPQVKKSEWSEEEDRAILEGVAVLGTRWCEIVKVSALQGRTDNAIKNRFYSLQRRMRSRQLNSKPSSPSCGKRGYEEGRLDACDTFGPENI